MLNTEDYPLNMSVKIIEIGLLCQSYRVSALTPSITEAGVDRQFDGAC